MDELNLQAERAAFEAFLHEEAPHDYDASNSDAWHIWQAARRAAPVAQLDAEIQRLNNIIGALTREAVAHQTYVLSQESAQLDADLPPLPAPIMGLWSEGIRKAWADQLRAYGQDCAKSAIAPHVERIRHLTEELEMERSVSAIQAEALKSREKIGPICEKYGVHPQPAQSIDTPEFREFMDDYDDKASYGSLKHARAGLVAFIDGRTAGTASEAVPEPVQPAPPAKPADEQDPLYDKAAMIVRAHNRASVSLVQRHLVIGYNRASRLLSAMEVAGIVSAMDQNGHRSMIAAAPSTQEGANEN